MVTRKHGSHGAWKVTPTLKAKVLRLFAEGLTQKEAWTKLKGALSKGTLNKLHKEWRASPPLIAEAAVKEVPAQVELSLDGPTPQAATVEPLPASGAIEVKKEESSYLVRAAASVKGGEASGGRRRG